MSLLFPYKPFLEVNDFYESFQDNYEPSEGFGRHVSGNLHPKPLKKILSARDAQSMLNYEQDARKCFSTQSFHENECEMANYYVKPQFAYCLEDHSTKGSFSSMTSINSFTSTPSATNTGNMVPVNNNNNCSKKRSRANESKKKVVADKDYRIKYKTEPCKYFTEKGYCEYGDQCAFAHGTGEIRQKAHISSNYKTKKCNQFHEMGYCPYGVRCQFIHSLRKDCQFNRVLEKTSYTEAMENPELWITHDPDCICMQSKTRRRFPSFQQVSAGESSEESNSFEKTVENLLETSM